MILTKGKLKVDLKSDIQIAAFKRAGYVAVAKEDKEAPDNKVAKEDTKVAKSTKGK